MVSCLEERGQDGTGILQRRGIDREQIRHPDAVLRPEQVGTLIRELMALDTQANLALLAGTRIHPGTLGLLGMAMSLSDTEAEALALCARFYEFVSLSVAMRIEPVGEWYALTWVPVRALPHDLLRVAFEMTIGAMHTRLTQGQTTRQLNADIYLSYAAPPHESTYQKTCPARYHFGQGGLPHLRFEVPRSLLDRRQPTAHADQLRGLLPQLALQAASQKGPRQWREWTVMMLQEALGSWPSQEDIAAIRGLSASTLGRNLAREGTSFRQLSNQVRMARAQAMLLDGRWSVEHIAEQLGYAHTTNFVRAFRKECGCPPLQFSRRHP